MNISNKLWVSLLALSVVAACADDGDTKKPDVGKQDAGAEDSGTDPDAGMPDASGKEDGSVSPGPTPRGADKPPSLGAQIDRVGRPAVSTALQATFESDTDKKNKAKDDYNAAEPEDWSDFAEGFASSLAILDALDGTCGNQLLAGMDAVAGRYDTLAGVLADDQLYVNTESGTCGVYLGLEAEFVGAVAEGEGGCGGRTPLDDIIDRSYSVLAAGVLTGVDDTITEDDATHDPSTFPFLAGPK